jgi:hypothetical protein
MANVQSNPAKTAGQTGRLQVRDESGKFLFHTNWLENYSVIKGPGKYQLTVTSKPQPFFPDPSEGTNPRFIVNVKAILQDDIPALQKLLKGKEFIQAEALRPYFLTGTIWVGDDGSVPELPIKGEQVECAIDYVPNRDGKEVLRITAMNVMPAQRAEKVNMAAFHADAEEEFTLDLPEEES